MRRGTVTPKTGEGYGRWRAGLWIRQVLLGPPVTRSKLLLFPMARLWRRLLFRTTFIAVTGSLGKTTTKECLAAVLAAHAPVYRTRGNQNGPLMVALNLLRVRPWHRFAVIEVAGASPGQLRRPAVLLRPEVAVILNVLRTHTTEFRDLAEHAAEKAVLLTAVPPHGVAILNQDDPLVAPMARQAPCAVVTFGLSAESGLRAGEVSAAWPHRLRFRVWDGSESLPVETRLVGEHWLAAAMASLAAARAVGVPLRKAASALREVDPFPGRLQPVRLPNGAIILRDDYNSSVDTVEASLRVLEQASAARRLLVMTDMSDFGTNRKGRLKYLGPALARAADVAVIIGENAGYGVRRAIEAGMPAENVHAFPTLEAAAGFLKSELREGDVALLKGRTTDHIARLFFAQLGPVTCWKEYCPKRMLCDTCWELDTTAAQLRRIEVVAPPR